MNQIVVQKPARKEVHSRVEGRRVGAMAEKALMTKVAEDKGGARG